MRAVSFESTIPNPKEIGEWMNKIYKELDSLVRGRSSDPDYICRLMGEAATYRDQFNEMQGS